MNQKKRFTFERLEKRHLLATFVVTTPDDAQVNAAGDAPGTLRQAVFDANSLSGSDVITFRDDIPTVVLRWRLGISDSLVIRGSGSQQLTIGAVTLKSRGVGINTWGDTTHVSFEGFTLRGYGSPCGPTELCDYNPGLVHGRGASLTLSDIVVADSLTRGISLEAGDLTLRNSVVIGADVGVYARGRGDVLLDGTTIRGNRDRGLNLNGVNVVINGSTITQNTATRRLPGGGIYCRSCDLTLRNSTVSGNQAARGGGIYAWGELTSVRIEHSTITNNTTYFSRNGGGGIQQQAGTLSIENAIVADNNPGRQREPAARDIMLMGDTTIAVEHSLIGTVVGTGLNESHQPDENGNLLGDPNGMGIIDPVLSPLGHFGGSTPTHALLPHSPAINMGDPNFEQRLGHDQRAAPFVRVSGDRLDMGAFEYQITPVDFTVDDHLNCSDVDALVAVIANGDDSPEFELTSDNSLDYVDLEVWLSLAGLENLSSRKAYLPGDANLDGKVDPTDLNVVGANWLDSVTGWCSGDFTANGVVNANDLNEVGLNWLQDVSGAAPRVPRAAFTSHVGHLMRRLVPDASVQRANQYTARNQIVPIRVDAEKPIDQVMRRQSGRHTGTSESRASRHHVGRELTAIYQHVDSVFEIWNSQ